MFHNIFNSSFIKKISRFTTVFFINLLLLNNFSYSESTRKLGKLHGHITTSENSDLSNILIQIAGAKEGDNFNITVTPDKNGNFKFDGLLPVESMVTLNIWDTSGFYNRTVLNAYVSEETRNPYEIYLQKSEYYADLARAFGLDHYLNLSGLCGQIIGLQSEQYENSRIFAYERVSKYYSSNVEPLAASQEAVYFNDVERGNSLITNHQRLDKNGQFCLFNLVSPSSTDLYDIVVFLPNGTRKTFNFYIPRHSFLTGIFLDLKSSVYRPVDLYLWHQNGYSLYKNDPLSELGFPVVSTSDDYAPISIFGSDLLKNQIYFPIGDESVEISYKLENKPEDRYFILYPRTKLITEKISRNLIQYEPGQIYQDTSTPVKLKILDEKQVQNLNSVFVSETYNQNNGSLFINIDLSKYDLHDKNEIKLSLRYLNGLEFAASFSDIDADKSFVKSQLLSGFIFNIPVGRYELFVTNVKDGRLLWSYEVRSYPNRIQVLTNDIDGLVELKQDRSIILPNIDSILPQEDIPPPFMRSKMSDEFELNLTSEDTHENHPYSIQDEKDNDYI